MKVTEECMDEKTDITGIDTQRKVSDFILSNRAAALATVDNAGVPHVAMVYCFADQDLNIYFSTRVEGRKYKNLVEHPIVSMTFYNEKSLSTVQLTGKASRVENLRTEQKILHELITLRYKEPAWPMPPIKLFERGLTNELAIIKVSPAEMTYADFVVTETGRYKPFFSKVI